jgi:hypothetical protein
MTEQAIVPPNTAGWMVRVKTPAANEEFWIAAFPDKADAEEAVRKRTNASQNEEVGAVATLSTDEILAQGMQFGDIKHATDA